MCARARVCSWCVLTFQSMVEKKECRLISSTPSGPAPADTDHCGSVGLARFSPPFILFERITRSHTHTRLSLGDGVEGGWRGFPRHVMLCGCQNATSLSKSERCNMRSSARHLPPPPPPPSFFSQQPFRCSAHGVAAYLVCWQDSV